MRVMVAVVRLHSLAERRDHIRSLFRGRVERVERSCQQHSSSLGPRPEPINNLIWSINTKHKVVALFYIKFVRTRTIDLFFFAAADVPDGQAREHHLVQHFRPDILQRVHNTFILLLCRVVEC